MRSKTTVAAWVVAVIVIIAIIIGAWYVNSVNQNTSRQAPVAASTAAAPAKPAIEHPIARATSAPAGASTAPLPTLAESDSTVTAALAQLTGDATIGKLLANRHVIQRVVATINALPQHEMGSNILPLRPPAGTLATRKSDGQLILAPSNYERYAPYMKWVRAADVNDLVSWYVHYYPLFQQAYTKLGYPDRYFNDRLVAVIDDLLKAPEPQGPLALVQTDTGYAFADPHLEGLSVGQKLMVRVGPANEKIIKQKLRAIRAAVTGQHGPATSTSAR